MVKSKILNQDGERYIGKYLAFEECTDGTWAVETIELQPLGYLEKIRIGAWMSWCLFLYDKCYLSASCQDEVREMTKILNSLNKSRE